MTINQVRQAMHAQPFRPFTVHLAGGRSYTVAHPDLIPYAPNGREMSIHDNDGVHLIEMLTAIEITLPPLPATPEEAAADPGDASPGNP